MGRLSTVAFLIIAAAWVMGLTLPVTVGVKLLSPGTAFLNQMWFAGLALIAVLGRDRLFDALCLGVIVLTAWLYVVFS